MTLTDGHHGAIAILAALLSLGLVNHSIWQKEQLLENGRVVYLELAPVDPRSLMQGDYMALDYQLSRAIRSALADSDEPASGLVVAGIDDRGVATFSRLHDSGPVAAEEQLLQFRTRNGRVRFASDAFFFQEGTAERYESAQYGRYRVSENGDLLLTGLVGENLEDLSGLPVMRAE